MSEPVFFVVRRIAGHERPALFYDLLPPDPLNQYVYVTRLDQLPDGDALAKRPLRQLYTIYCSLKQRNALPPRYTPPPRPKAAPAKVLTGEKYHHIDNARWRDRPFVEPVPGEPRPNAPAFIAGDPE